VLQGDLAGLGVEGRDVRPGQQLDVVVGVEALVMDVELGSWLLAAQILLGQHGTLVGPLGLLADQHHPAVEALGAQRLGGLGSGQACADDDKRLF
jgi:hypothetical protein